MTGRPKRPRKELRHLIEVPVEIRGTRRLIHAVGRDLTFGGIRIRTTGHLTEEERVGVTLLIPGFAPEDLSFPADVRWVERGVDGREEVAGLEFAHTPETKKKLHLLLTELESGNLREIQRRTPTMRWKAPRS